MRQIIKAIWKSNEVPTNEYFLWLKHEDKGFMLYVRGQQGWEPITSEGQISDVYTKEEIDTILGDYYKKTESDEKYLPLSAGETKPLTGDLYARGIKPVSNALAFGVRDENRKYVPYIYPARTIYDSGRWGVKRVISYVGDGSTPYVRTGIMDFIIPAVSVLKYHITVSGGYENPIMTDMHIYVLQSAVIPIQVYHSGSALEAGSPGIEIQVAKTLDNKLHLLIGKTTDVYPPMTMVEIDVITTVTGQVNVDDVWNSLNPEFITDVTGYTILDTLYNVPV